MSVASTLTTLLTHRKADSARILCLYVLNVLLPEEQAHVLMAVSELLAPTGRGLISPCDATFGVMASASM